MIHYVSVINDIDHREVENYDSKKLIKNFKNCRKQLIISGKYRNKIEVENTELSLINFNHIKLGQFIDIESYINNGYIDNLHLITSCLYLRIEGGGMYEMKPEPIGEVNKKYRGQKIQSLPVSYILGACNQYLQFRLKFFDSYSVFQDPFEDVDENEMTEEELQLLEEEKTQMEKDRKTQWIRILNTLTDNDMTKFEHVLDQNLFFVFNQYEFIRAQKRNK